ncbi:TonB family protein [Daejeonella sp. JGW-45]|uniref:TonB family protein n=1 Tax=Daejeonella sp. JGW-45 TaxID=3034148 RepID=UPI0023EB269C|nr:TonB family protein [Daejeonella sp. JGW-45]
MYPSITLGFILSLAGLFGFREVISVNAQEQPAFKGGQKALVSFIDNNLIYPEFSKENCLQGTIQVSFRLNRQGKIYDSKIQKGFGTDLDLEALRVVRLTSGKWIIPTNHDTLISLVLPVNFSLRDFKCDQRSRDEINAAISAYHARVGMNDAIFNFYDKKALGTYDQADEARIQDLKAQLGYDEKFIERLLKLAQRKLKQGDKEGACEDFQTVRRLGSDVAAGMIAQHCK